MGDAEIDALIARLAGRPRPTELSERRKRLDLMGEQTALPPGIVCETALANGVPAEWTTSAHSDPGRVVLYFHGGGYIAGSIVSHRAMVAQAGLQARAKTLAAAYRLAPEHPFPAAVDDALSAYAYLLARGIEPTRIVVAGDSAGAGIALALMLSLRERGRPLPAAAWCLSPWIDLEMTGGSMTDRAHVDPLIAKPYLQEVAASYLAGGDARCPLVSPLYADLRGLPPLLIQVGGAETLLDDALRLARAAAYADIAVTLETYPDMIHVWPLFFNEVAAGRRALASAGEFVRRLTA